MTMRINPLRFMTMGLAGLVATGLIAFQQTSANGITDKPAFKRDDNGSELVAVDDDGDDDGRDGDTSTGTNTGTGTNGATNTGTNTNTGTQTRTGDNTGTGTQTGRDHSRNRQVRDWTHDGDGRHRDWTSNDTNDRSRHNTRG